jgi:predicted MFS family arabinose efflux permease
VEIAEPNAAAAAPRRRRGGLLWQRNFRLLWAGETVSSAGNSMAVVGVPFLAVAVLHASTFAVSALTAAEYLPWLVIGLPAGAWVDRLPARHLMIVCDVVSALLFASLPAAAWLGVLSISQILAVALLTGATSVFFSTAYQVCLPALVNADDLMEGNAKLQGSASVTSFGGRGAAGLAAQAVGAASALLFNAGSFLVSAACLLSIRAAAPQRPPARRTSVRAEISVGARLILGDPLLRILTVNPALANLTFSGASALFVVFLVRVAGFGAAAVGLLMAASGVGSIIGAMLARRVARRLGTARALLLGTLGAGLFGLLIPLAGAGPRAAFYVVGLAATSGGLTAGNIILMTFRQAYCPPAMLGRVTASQRFLVFGTIPLGALLAGALGTAFGIRTALWALLGGFAVSGILLLFSRPIRAGRDLPVAVARHDVPPGSQPAEM